MADDTGLNSTWTDRFVVNICRAQRMDLCIPVALLHVAAFSMGYFICKGLGFNEKTSRTVSIETGIWHEELPNTISL